MYKVLLSLFTVLFISAGSILAQNPFRNDIPASPQGFHRCYTDQLAHERYEQDPAFRDRIAQFSNSNRNENVQSQMFWDGIVRIPVVVHVVHNNGPENISKAQIESQIRILNEDFRKIAGTNGGGPGADTEIEFFLAKKDENGVCTDGILRYQNATLTNHNPNDALKTTVPNWNPTKYLNIWVVDAITNNIGGYANYASGLTGPNDPNDGLVAADHVFGDMGTSGGGLYGNGRTSTHEIGHWLGLRHTFAGCDNGDCVNNGDQVCDTPPASSPTYQCTANNQCGGAVQIENYMDYTPDLCMDRFTQGQADRMLAQMTQYRSNLLDSMNAINAGYYGCAVSLSDKISDKNIEVYPNPASDNFNIKVNTKVNASYKWQLSNLSGEILMNSSNISSNGEATETINIQKLSDGFYLLKITFETGEVVTKKINKH